MKPLFSKASLMILESLSFTKTLFAFDFDGTLSRIVRIPQDAGTTPTTNELMNQLSGLVPVAVVSGRSLSDLRHRLQFKPQFLIGNHGIEGLNRNTGSIKEAQTACDSWRDKLKGIEFGPGVEIEDKTYSLAIHFRRSRNKKMAKERIKEAILSLNPEPRIVTGKSVVNILPSAAPHKGAALLELMNTAGVKHAFYIGDDDTDEDVFDLPGARIMTVRVGYKKSSHAQFYIQRQSQINSLLRTLVRYHKRGL